MVLDGCVKSLVPEGFPFLTFLAASARPPTPSVQTRRTALFSIFSGRLGAPKNGEKPDARFGSKKILPEGPVKFWEAFFFSIWTKKTRISGPAEAQNQLFSFLTHLGVPWEPLGAVLGALGASWGPTGPMLAALGRFLVPDGPSWTNFSRIDRIFQAWEPTVKAAGRFSTSFCYFSCF